MGFLKPPSPPPPPPPPPPPAVEPPPGDPGNVIRPSDVVDTTEKKLRNTKNKRVTRRTSRVTGPRGLLDEAPVERRTLLGSNARRY